jgi:hypothetical protein
LCLNQYHTKGMLIISFPGNQKICLPHWVREPDFF